MKVGAILPHIVHFNIETAIKYMFNVFQFHKNESRSRLHISNEPVLTSTEVRNCKFKMFISYNGILYVVLKHTYSLEMASRLTY